jgi:hypothetical protein
MRELKTTFISLDVFLKKNYVRVFLKILECSHLELKIWQLSEINYGSKTLRFGKTTKT